MQIIEYDKFSGGVNNTLSLNNLKNNEVVEALNIDFSETGGFSNRKGCKKLNKIPYSKEVIELLDWTIGSEKRLIAVLKSATTYDLVRINPIDGSLISTFKTSTSPIFPFIFKGKVFFGAENKLYSYGDFQYSPTSTATNIKAGEIVLNKPKSTGGGEEGRMYKAKSDISISNATNFADTSKFDDVTDILGQISNQIQEVKGTLKDYTNPSDPKDIKDNIVEKTIGKCTIFAFHEKTQRMFASGNKEDPAALYYSERSDMKYWKETSVLYPSQNDMGKVTGLKGIMDKILVAYENGWFSITGGIMDQGSEWKRLPIPYGCISGKSIVLTPWSLTFLGKDGLYVMSVNAINDMIVVQSDDLVKNVSADKVETTIRSIENPSDTTGVFYDGKYLLSFKDKESPKILVFYFDKGTFSIYDGYDVKDFLVSTDNKLLYGCLNYILIAEETDADIDVNTGAAKPIKMRLRTKSYDLSEGLNSKDVQFVYLLFKQYLENPTSPMSIKLYTDYGSVKFGAVDISESLVWGRSWGKIWGYTDFVEMEAEVKKIGRRFSFEFEKNVLNDRTTVYAVAFRFKGLSPRGTVINYERGLNE